MNSEWIAARRAEITMQKDNAMSIFNQAAGALRLLDAVEAELNKPPVEPPAGESPKKASKK